MSSYSSSSERPTLPSLHTLNLLPPSYAQRRGGSPDESYEQPCPRLYIPQHSWSRRRVSTSTSSSTSRTPSPTPSGASSCSSASSTLSSTSPSKLTLIPSSFEDAQAIVLVTGTGTGQSLLLTGRALEHFRHPQRQIAKGTRLHPYRFGGRRPSTASSLPSP
ncbi:hypothetical protein K438DRAFT_1974187 [Mycena galopus ATCC 62051]|nr:hypothetical protein K438DRAFT_1974187 [Mycena galopus ATCC 62051]